MSLNAATAVPVDLLKAGPSRPAGASPERSRKAAEDFEAAFLSIMLGQMFEGVSAGEFSGGQGEDMFKSFMMDAFAKQITRSGGVGLADSVQREMLKLQGLEG